MDAAGKLLPGDCKCEINNLPSLAEIGSDQGRRCLWLERWLHDLSVTLTEMRRPIVKGKIKWNLYFCRGRAGVGDPLNNVFFTAAPGQERLQVYTFGRVLQSALDLEGCWSKENQKGNLIHAFDARLANEELWSLKVKVITPDREVGQKYVHWQQEKPRSKWKNPTVRALWY